ncbi:hypothetical protein G4F95_30760 [Escherichia coli]|nr:hypothetical protein [Escherichia coli]
MLDADMQCHLVDFGSSSSDKEPKPVSWGTASYIDSLVLIAHDV